MVFPCLLICSGAYFLFLHDVLDQNVERVGLPAMQDLYSKIDGLSGEYRYAGEWGQTLCGSP